MPDKFKTIKGRNGYDHISPESGNGKIEIGNGPDTVVISEGDFYQIKGFEDNDNSAYARPYDELLMFIEPEKEDFQEVEYFTSKGHTYVQIYDNEKGKVVAATKFIDEDVKIKVVGENGNLGVKPNRLYEDNSPHSLDAARKIDMLIARGEAKELVKDVNIESASETSYNKGEAYVKGSELLKK